MKVFIILGIAAILLGASFFFLNQNQEEPTEKVLDCSSPPNVFYLKPSESSNSQEILEDPNAIVVIPELNRVLANSELLNCEGIDFKKLTGGIR